MENPDTIVAIASPPGEGRRGVVRVSGPAAAELLGAVLRSEDLPQEGLRTRAWFTGRLLDGTGEQPVLVLWMPGPRSYTREDVVEFHLPGSPPLLACALGRLIELGARPARPGEFTRRAFENGRIDLSRAEGIAELVAAGSDAERRAALELLGGGLSRRLAPLREAIDTIRALLEASLDFDAEDTGHVPTEELLAGLAHAARGLDEALSWEAARQAPSTLPRVVLYGAPNAGKSSLFNSLGALEGSAALVSGEAGTTRDVLRALWWAGETQVLLADTAGLRAERTTEGRARPTGPREGSLRAAVEALAERELRSADLVLWLADSCREREPGLAALRAEARRLPASIPVLCLWSRTDREGSRPAGEAEEALLRERSIPLLPVSGLRGEGLGELGRAVERTLAGAPGEHGVARELFARHRNALLVARGAIAAACDELPRGVPLDLVAETLRGATGALDEIEGHTSSEDLLDHIFSRFCLGK